MAPLATLVVLLGRTSIICGVFVLSLMAYREFARATGLHRHFLMMATVNLGIVAVFVLTLISDPRTPFHGWYGLFMALPAFITGLILTVPVFLNSAKGQLQSVALAITGFLYFGWMFGHLGFLANRNLGPGVFFFLLISVELTDISAFLCGKMFGRTKLRNRISPNKTLEGALGALGVAMLLPWIFRFSLPSFQPLHLILTGLIVGIGGQLGDLSISFIKRDLGIKDMGSLIPGHGGVLDRIDSMIFVVPLFFHMTRWFFPMLLIG